MSSENPDIESQELNNINKYNKILLIFFPVIIILWMFFSPIIYILVVKYKNRFSKNKIDLTNDKEICKIILFLILSSICWGILITIINK